MFDQSIESRVLHVSSIKDVKASKKTRVTSKSMLIVSSTSLCNLRAKLSSCCRAIIEPRADSDDAVVMGATTAMMSADDTEDIMKCSASIITAAVDESWWSMAANALQNVKVSWPPHFPGS